MSQPPERCGAFVVESRAALQLTYTDADSGATMTLTATGNWAHLAQHIEELTFAALDTWLDETAVGEG